MVYAFTVAVSLFEVVFNRLDRKFVELISIKKFLSSSN